MKSLVALCSSIVLARAECYVIFSVSDVSERFKESISRFPANFKKISESRILDLSRDPTSHRAKISLFQNMLGFIQYGSRFFGIDASSDSAKFQDDWLSESGLNVKFKNKNWRKMANLTNEKAEFAIAIFRHCPPPPIYNTCISASGLGSSLRSRSFRTVY